MVTYTTHGDLRYRYVYYYSNTAASQARPCKSINTQLVHMKEDQVNLDRLGVAPSQDRLLLRLQVMFVVAKAIRRTQKPEQSGP